MLVTVKSRELSSFRSRASADIEISIWGELTLTKKGEYTQK